MVSKAKIFYFTVFILVVMAFIFHVTAMGHNHWKKAESIYGNTTTNYTSIGLFTICTPSTPFIGEVCFPNKYPMSESCADWRVCRSYTANDTCQCDYTPSTKGIAACAIIAAVFLGLAIIVLFIHSINTSETRSVGLILGFFPLILLLLSFIFILITLILVGSYLSRDIMHFVRQESTIDYGILRDRAAQWYTIRVDWGTGLEIIALVLTFFSLVLYSVFVFKIGRSK